MKLAALLLCTLLLPEQAGAFRERDGSQFQLRSRRARVDEAFRKLRVNFQREHPNWSAEHAKQGKLSTVTKSVTPAPPALVKVSSSVSASPVVSNGTVSMDDILFGVWTDSLFYDTRLAGILDTWGKEIPAGHFMAVSDKKREVPEFEMDGPATSHLPGTDVEETKCPAHSHWEGACCKWAEGIILAQERMEKNPKLKWAFFSDDDVYLRPAAVATALHAKPSSDKPVAFGVFGCSTPGGCAGLCGGGGFALSKAAVNKMAAKDPAAFLEEQMSMCGKCDRWADQAISMVWKDKGVEMQQMEGLNGWQMKEDDFKAQLTNGNPNLLFHYEKTPNQLKALHEIFGGKRLLKEEKGPCVEYKGHKTCAASYEEDDVPFIANPV